jgi:hypothetical protein
MGPVFNRSRSARNRARDETQSAGNQSEGSGPAVVDGGGALHDVISISSPMTKNAIKRDLEMAFPPRNVMFRGQKGLRSAGSTQTHFFRKATSASSATRNAAKVFATSASS